MQKTVFSFNPYNELSFPTFNLRYETQPRPSIWLEFSRISAAHSPLSTMPIPIATDINSRCEQYFRFSTRIATFRRFRNFDESPSYFSNLRSLAARSKRISKFLSDKIFPRLPSPFAIKNDKRKKRNEDGILYAYKYNVVLASHPVHHGCTIVKEYRCNSTNT